MAKGSLAGANQYIEERADALLNGGAAFRILIGDFVGTISFFGKVSDDDTPFPLGVTQYNDEITIATSCTADFAGWVNTIGLSSILAKVTVYTSGAATVTVGHHQG